MIDLSLIRLIGAIVGFPLLMAALLMAGFHRSIRLGDRVQIVLVRCAPLLAWITVMVMYPLWSDLVSLVAARWVFFGSLAASLAAVVIIGRLNPAVRAAMARAREVEAYERDEMDVRAVRRMGRGHRARAMGNKQ